MQQERVPNKELWKKLVSSQCLTKYEEGNLCNWFGQALRRNDDNITKQAYSGHHKATEEQGDQGILGKKIWRKKCGQQDTSTAGGRWRRQQHKTELDGDKWYVAFWSLSAYKARITSGISDVCPECGATSHSVEHLFNCQSHPTQLTVQDLAEVADFLSLDN